MTVLCIFLSEYPQILSGSFIQLSRNMTKYFEQEKKGQCPLLYLGLIVWHMLLLKCVTAWSLSDPSLLCASKWG